MKKIYVGGIGFEAVASEFSAFVEEKVGPIAELAWITNRFDGNFRGFAFVTFQNEGDDVQALLVLNGMVFDGHTLKVAEATARRS